MRAGLGGAGPGPRAEKVPGWPDLRMLSRQLIWVGRATEEASFRSASRRQSHWGLIEPGLPPALGTGAGKGLDLGMC